MAAITSIDINNGVTMRAQDMSIIKANEDARPHVEHFDLQMALDREHEENLSKIQEQADIEKENFRFDAKEEGGGAYSNQERKKKKKEDEESEGSFSLKNPSGSFDITI